MNVKIQRNARAVIYEQHFTLELYILFKYFVFLIKDAAFFFFCLCLKIGVNIPWAFNLKYTVSEFIQLIITIF